MPYTSPRATNATCFSSLGSDTLAALATVIVIGMVSNFHRLVDDNVDVKALWFFTFAHCVERAVVTEAEHSRFRHRAR